MISRSRRIRERYRPQPRELIDATPERIGKGDSFDWVNPGEIDSSEQGIGRVRCFRKVSRLDLWHRRQTITQRQWWAGNEYRRQHAIATHMPRVVASYGERTTGGAHDAAYVRTEAQQRAKGRWLAARASIDIRMVGFLDRFLIHDRLPDYRGRAQMRTLAEARNALDKLAEHFEGRR